MRERFEEWARKAGLNLKLTHDGVYVYPQAFYAWLGWQAASSAQRHR